MNDTVGQVEDALVVRHHDHRVPVLLREDAKELGDGVAVVGVEGGGRLVGKQDGGRAGEGAGNGDALALPAGQVARLRVELVGKADRFKQANGVTFSRPCPSIRGAAAASRRFPGRRAPR